MTMVASPESVPAPITPGPSSGKPFDVVEAYQRALRDDNNPHPIAAILALVETMEASTTETTSGLARELKAARQQLVSTQPSLGVRAGCQLWGNFFADSASARTEFAEYKANLIQQGRAFCSLTAAQCRDKIAELAVGFLRDDCTILTHSYSRTVMKTLLRASRQHKRIRVYVTEARPDGWGHRTHAQLTAANIPCTLVLDSAVAYVMERVDMVLVGSEAVVESGGLVSAVGTYQIALLAKAHQKPFYALAESYKFLRHYPLSQTDLPLPKLAKLHGQPVIPLSFDTPGAASAADDQAMVEINPRVDVTMPSLIDYIITDLGSPLSPTSVSQYIVAQFAG